MQPLKGKDVRVGQYRLLAELGAGGMGRVYLASAPDGSLAAVKQINPQYAADKGFRARFRREVDAARRVSGAYTSAIITADPDASTPWLASVYVPGPSLEEALDAVGVLPEATAVQLAARLASALADIHRAGLVHRDLKPSNVLLVDDGLRVIDFGIVRAADAGSSTETTLTAFAVGSPAYMSPEQAEGGQIGTASDIFSLGALLTLACTGKHPFNVPGNVDASMRNVVDAEPDLRAIPVRLRGIVELCLEKDPANRPTPAQVLALLGKIPPTSRPWPPEVYDLIAERRDDVERLLSGKRIRLRRGKPQSRRDRDRGRGRKRAERDGAEAEAHRPDPPTRPMSATRPDIAPPVRRRRSPLRPILWVCAGILALALVVAAPVVGWELLVRAAGGLIPSPMDTAAPWHLPDAELNDPEDAVAVVSFKETVTYEDGLKVEISRIQHGKVSQGAVVNEPGADKTTFIIRITNGTKEPYDSSVSTSATYGEAGIPADSVFDSGDDTIEIDYGFNGIILPGKSMSGAVAFAIPSNERDDVTLQVEVRSLGKPAIFTGSTL